MSRLLFNLIIDTVLQSIPDEVGYCLGETKINSLAFTDDLVLITTTKIGMQTAIDCVEFSASWVGPSINPAKCSTVSMFLAEKLKNVKIWRPAYRDHTR